jgi:hypothetical protein
MRKLIELSIVVQLFLFAATVAFSQDWYKFDSDTSNFQAEFPQKPDVNIKRIIYEASKVIVKYVTYKANDTTLDENIIYSVSVSEYPDTAIYTDNIVVSDSIIKKNINNIVKVKQGKILKNERILWNDHWGREYVFEVPQIKTVISSRCFIYQGKMYTVTVVSNVGKEYNKSILKFLNSFKFLK